MAAPVRLVPGRGIGKDQYFKRLVLTAETAEFAERRYCIKGIFLCVLCLSAMLHLVADALCGEFF